MTKVALAVLMLAAMPACAVVNGIRREDRKFEVRVIHYDMNAAVLDAIPPEDTLHLDSLSIEILSPEEYKGNTWHLWIYNNVWEPAEDYGYRAGDIVEIDVPRFRTTRWQIRQSIASSEGLSGFWIQNSMISKLSQVAEPSPASGGESP